MPSCILFSFSKGPGWTEPQLPTMVTNWMMHLVLTFLHSVLFFSFLIPISWFCFPKYTNCACNLRLCFLEQSWLKYLPKQMQSDSINRCMVAGTREVIGPSFIKWSVPVYYSFWCWHYSWRSHRQAGLAQEEATRVGKELNAVSQRWVCRIVFVRESNLYH